MDNFIDFVGPINKQCIEDVYKSIVLTQFQKSFINDMVENNIESSIFMLTNNLLIELNVYINNDDMDYVKCICCSINLFINDDYYINKKILYHECYQFGDIVTLKTLDYSSNIYNMIHIDYINNLFQINIYSNLELIELNENYYEFLNIDGLNMNIQKINKL